MSKEEREPTPYEQASEDVKRLLRILSTRRAHNSLGEEMFYEVFLRGNYQPEVFVDDKGEELAYVLTNEPDKDNPSKVLWSCHIDTMHGKGDEKLQNISYDPFLALVYKEDNECLGADDGLGVWLLLEMYDAGVPGTYVFHRGEERGGIGSGGMFDHHRQWLTQFNYAIAFDRRKTHSVITHQSSERCCSNEFADGVIAALSDSRYKFEQDDGGTFTDTANYTGVIPECTNISAGYEHEHTGRETLDVDYAVWLRARMLEVGASFRDLPVKRDPSTVERLSWGWEGYGRYGSWGATQERVEQTVVPFRRKRRRLTDIDPDTVSASDIDKMLPGELRKWVNSAKVDDIVQVLFVLAGETVEAYDEVDRLTREVEDLTYDMDMMGTRSALQTALDLDDDDDGLALGGGRYAG